MLLIPRRTAGAVALAVGLSGLALAPAAASSAAVATDAIGGPALASTGVVVTLGPGAAPLPTVAAKSWVLADLTTGEVLAAKDAHRRGRPASTLKTLTAVTLLPVLDKNTQHVVTYQEASADGGHVGVVPDASYSAWDLWHGLLLPSGNDAAAALAGAHGGMKKTVADMQAMAGRLQAADTTVRNPSGLDADGQVTSAYDMALFAKAAMANEDFRTLTKTISYDFPGRPAKPGKQRTTYKIYTQNRLLLHGYKGTVGGKTGFTTKAGRTFWAAAERGGHLLVVTLLQVKQPTETAAEALLTWGFRNRGSVTPVGTLVDALPEGAAPTPQESASAPAGSGSGSAIAVGATTAASSSSAGSGLPGWAWLLGLGLVVAGVVALVLGRGRRNDDPTQALPGATALAATTGSTVLPGPVAASPVVPAAARTSPSVVVSTPGRRVDVEFDPQAEASTSVVDAVDTVDTASALEATGPMPVIAVAAAADAAPEAEALAAPVEATRTGPSDGASSEPDALDLDVPAAADEAPQAPPNPPAPTRPQSGGNVRVIRPPGPGSA